MRNCIDNTSNLSDSGDSEYSKGDYVAKIAGLERRDIGKQKLNKAKASQKTLRTATTED